MRCATCGYSYPDHYTECPGCERTKKGSARNRLLVLASAVGAIAGVALLAFVLVATAASAPERAYKKRMGEVGREYIVLTESVLVVLDRDENEIMRDPGTQKQLESDLRRLRDLSDEISAMSVPPKQAARHQAFAAGLDHYVTGLTYAESAARNRDVSELAKADEYFDLAEQKMGESRALSDKND